MLRTALLAATLLLGQTESPTPPAEAPPAPAPPAADRWLLMKTLQGTWPGAVLDENRLRVWGWTDLSFTASTAEHNQLPMGFNYLANQFALQQNWLRVERTVVTSGTTEPTFGFRTSWILPRRSFSLRFVTIHRYVEIPVL